jgi:integrase
MARTLRDARLETRAARERLPVGRKPHFKTLIPGQLHLGYRRKARHAPGQWLVRVYLGRERYHVAVLGVADDFTDVTPANGVANYAEAQKRALAHCATRHHEGLTVEDALERYINWLRVDRPASAKDAQLTAERHILPWLGATALSALTTEAITAWRDRLAAGPAYDTRPLATADRHRARRATTNRIFCVLRAALNKAFENGVAQNATAWKRVKQLRNTTQARHRILTVEEAQRLINAADGPSGFRDLVHAALLTGARYGELAKVQVQDFKHDKLHITMSKSGQGRWIVLTEEGVAFFTQLTVGRSGDEPLLLRDGHSPWRKSVQLRRMAVAVTAARLRPRITFHGLRHTYASLSVMAGMPLMVLARNLGHRDTTMVQHHYGHMEGGFIDAEIQKAAPRFGMVIATNVKTLAKRIARPDIRSRRPAAQGENTTAVAVPLARRNRTSPGSRDQRSE